MNNTIDIPAAVQPGDARLNKVGDRRGVHLMTHGLAKTRTHRIWCKIKERCNNPKAVNYARYGGRGIYICQEWADSFETFLADMGTCPEKHSIERRNNMGPYCKENCEWATTAAQANNKRNNRVVEYQGVTQSIACWCRQLGLNYNKTRQRIYRNGWTAERAFKI